MRVRRRRHRGRWGPLTVNRQGATGITSVVLRLPLWRDLVLWERRR